MAAIVVVQVERPRGPGVDLVSDVGGHLVGRTARTGFGWLGFDWAVLLDSDDGRGRSVPVIVAVPSSTFAGCRLEIELAGGWRTDRGPVLLGALPGVAAPPDLARIDAGIDPDAPWIDAADAVRLARSARQRHRLRASRGRITGGRAWNAIGALPPELARQATPHSAAEYRIDRLPARFLRGLEGLLDDDERLLHWVERPVAPEPGLIDRFRGRTDRRAALLALTDRQLLWVVDHAQPDRFLSDWGVDVTIVPVERVIEVDAATRARHVELTVRTRAGGWRVVVPSELADEVGVLRALLARFTPTTDRRHLRRRYGLEPVIFDAEPPARFGQQSEARELFDRAAARGTVLGFVYSPRRPGQASAAALALTPDRVELLGSTDRGLDLAAIGTIGQTLSPLVGRIAIGSAIRISYPSPLSDAGAAFVRAARRALANVG